MAGRTLLVGIMLALAATANADVLLLDRIEAGAPASTARPARGATMQRVEASLGAPTQRMPAIGEPPITRWEYPGLVVYFEYDHVIHSVSRP
jgi:hypothetical protein